MLQNYSKPLRIAMVLILPIWVLVSFYTAQILVVGLVSVLIAVKVPLESYNTAVLNTSLAALVYILTLAIVIGVPFIAGKHRINLVSIGFTRLPSWTDILLTPAALVAYFALSTLFILMATNVLPGFDVNQVQDTGFGQFNAQYEYILAFITLVVIAPIAEEILFRGYLYGKLKKFAPVWVSVLVTSLLFGSIHGAWNLVLDTFALSIVLCLLRESTGNIWASILLHMAKNGIAFYLLFINPSIFTILK